ncbi:MAG: lamin tail domain-containing protein [Chitinophagales bacterium]|nr:lamin tail domain-containing protein [Chitinophagales bacterium]
MHKALLLSLMALAVIQLHATIHTVTVNSNFFSPASITIQAGDTIVWNCVSGCHNVNGSTTTFPSNPASFGNSVACSPWVYTFIFNTTGIYSYQCDPHSGSGMTGVITVNAATPTVVIPNVWINEIHYDNIGNDTLEGFEIAGPAGTNLACYKVYRYNGANGQLYGTNTLSGIIPNQACGFGAVWFPVPVDGMQNGSPDGIVLEYAPQATGCGVNHADTILQLLSYEGSFVATNGRANGLTLNDIGVSQNGNQPIGNSLQLGGVGNAYSQFTWQSSLANTYNNVNTNQYFCGTPVSTYRFSPTSLTVNENAGNIVAGYVKATNVYAPSQTVQIVLKTGSAADVNGYNTQTLTFTLGGVDSLPFNLIITDDALVEGTEVLEFVLRNPSLGSIHTDSIFSLTILDNDVPAPVVQFLTSLSSVPENADSVQIPVSITNPAATPTTVDIMIMPGSATLGVDYSYAPATITFPANSSTNQFLTVYIQNDLFAEGNETATFMLMNPSGGATVGTNGMHTLTIVDDDVQQIYFNAVSQTKIESAGTISLDVILNKPGATSTSVSLQLVSAGTTATQGVDFLFSDTVITWAQGTSGAVSIPITIIDDNLYEFNETVKLRLSNQTSGVFLVDTNFTLTIFDNDPLPTADCANLFFSEYVEGTSNNKALEIYNPTSNAINLADYRIYKSLNGGSSTGIFNLTGSIAAGDVYVLVYNQADSILKLKADTLTSFLNFNGNDALALLHLNDTIDVIGQIGIDPGTSWVVGTGSTVDHTLIRNYYTYKGSKDWQVAANQWDSHPVNLFDSLQFHHTAPCGTTPPMPKATLRFLGTSATVAEAVVTVNVIVETVNPSGQNANFVVARDNAASTAIAGLDYNFTNQTLSRGAGTSIDTVHIEVLDDNLIESSETVVLRFINVSSNVQIGADSVYVLTITDSDVLSVGFVGAGFSYVEDAGTVYVRVALSTQHSDTVKASVTLAAGNATKGTDFLFNDTTVVFLPNSNDTQAVAIVIIDDNLHEVNEQINLNLSVVSGGAVLGISAYTLTIVDNDSAVGISKLDWENNLKVFPNPVQNMLNVESDYDAAELRISDVLGNIVVPATALNKGKNMIDMSYLPQGMYFITATNQGTAVTKRLLKTD